MLHALLIAQQRDAAELLTSLIRSSGQVVLDRAFSPAPSFYQLTTALNTLALDVAFIDVSNPEQAGAACEQIREKGPQIALVGFSAGPAGSQCSTAITQFTLNLPLSTAVFAATVKDAVHSVSLRPHKNVYAIMPAKGGSGASTIAINVAAQFAQYRDQRVLVADCDLRSGTIAECLGLRPEQSIGKTLSDADAAETLIWSHHVRRKAGIDFLLTTRERTGFDPEWHSYHHLLSFVARRYEHIFIDLPEVVTDATAEVVQSAETVYVVTTPEMLSLQLARQRIDELQAVQVERSRIKILVNRWHKEDLKPREIAEILDCPVAFAIPNDYREVSNAVAARSFVEPNNKLGRAYRAWASAIIGEPVPPAKERHRTFWELFRPVAEPMGSPW
jgi:pilus assembly protein CpaE